MEWPEKKDEKHLTIFKEISPDNFWLFCSKCWVIEIEVVNRNPMNKGEHGKINKTLYK